MEMRIPDEAVFYGLDVAELRPSRRVNSDVYLAKKQNGRTNPQVRTPVQKLIARLNYALKELPQPQVDFVFGLLNLKPEPSSVST